MREKLILHLPYLALYLAGALSLWVLYWMIVPRSWRRGLLVASSAAMLLAVFGPLYLVVYGAILLATYAAAEPGNRSRIAPIVAGIVAADLALFGYAYLAAWKGWPGAAYFSRIEVGFFAHIMGAYSVARLIIYTREVCTGQTPRHGLLSFLVYVAFLPSFFMGPIARYGKFWEEARPDEPAPLREQMRRGAWKLARSGLMCIPLGAVLVAMGHVTRDGSFLDHSPHFTPMDAWTLTCLRTLLWFTGFSVYTDLAIGTGRLFGYELPENFGGVAFLKQNMSEWWRTWHITMSYWVRDYLYIPLGGNKGNPTLHFTVAFIVCGLWHAPRLHYALWGAMNGAALAAHRRFRQWRKEKYGEKPPTLIGRVASYVVTFLFFGMTWAFFVYPTDEALRYYALLFGMRF